MLLEVMEINGDELKALEALINDSQKNCATHEDETIELIVSLSSDMKVHQATSKHKLSWSVSIIIKEGQPDKFLITRDYVIGVINAVRPFNRKTRYQSRPAASILKFQKVPIEKHATIWKYLFSEQNKCLVIDGNTIYKSVWMMSDTPSKEDPKWQFDIAITINHEIPAEVAQNAVFKVFDILGVFPEKESSEKNE